MPNMSYCRFGNTVNDLQDCLNNIEAEGLSEDEEIAREALIEVCKQRVEADHGNQKTKPPRR